jgi:hypothetical protein
MTDERGFDFTAFAAALERKDAAAWSDFYAENAGWREYREGNPPSSPNLLTGPVIRGFIEAVSASQVELRVSHEVVGHSRVASGWT